MVDLCQRMCATTSVWFVRMEEPVSTSSAVIAQKTSQVSAHLVMSPLMMSQLRCLMMSCMQVCCVRRACVWRRTVAWMLMAPPPLWPHTFTCWRSSWSAPPSADHDHWPEELFLVGTGHDITLFQTGSDLMLDVTGRLLILTSCLLSNQWKTFIL